MKSALGWIPVILFALFSFRKEQLHGLIGLHTHMILGIVVTGFICFLLLPAFIIYTSYTEEFSRERPYLQIFLFSLLSLFLFQWGYGSQYYEDSLLVVLGILYLVSFNFLYPNLNFIYKKMDILNEKQKFNLFKKYPPTHTDDLIRPKLFFFVMMPLIPVANHLYWKAMMG